MGSRGGRLDRALLGDPRELNSFAESAMACFPLGASTCHPSLCLL